MPIGLFLNHSTILLVIIFHSGWDLQKKKRSVVLEVYALYTGCPTVAYFFHLPFEKQKKNSLHDVWT